MRRYNPQNRLFFGKNENLKTFLTLRGREMQLSYLLQRPIGFRIFYRADRLYHLYGIVPNVFQADFRRSEIRRRANSGHTNITKPTATDQPDIPISDRRKSSSGAQANKIKPGRIAAARFTLSFHFRPSEIPVGYSVNIAILKRTIATGKPDISISDRRKSSSGLKQKSIMQKDNKKGDPD